MDAAKKKIKFLNYYDYDKNYLNLKMIFFTYLFTNLT